MFKWRKKRGEASPLIFLKKKVWSPVPCRAKTEWRSNEWKADLIPSNHGRGDARVEILRFQLVVLKYPILMICLSCPPLLPHMLDHSCGDSVQTLDRTSMPFHCLLTCSRSNTNKLLLILQLEEHRIASRHGSSVDIKVNCFQRFKTNFPRMKKTSHDFKTVVFT